VGLAVLVLFVGMAYLVLLSPTSTRYYWGITTCAPAQLLDVTSLVGDPQGACNTSGWITWVDPNSPASDRNIVSGDRVVAATTAQGVPLPLSSADTAATLRVRHRSGREESLVAPAPLFSTTGAAAAFVLLALVFVLCGLTVWLRAVARGAALHMMALSTIIALMLMADIGGQQGQALSERLMALCSGVYLPILFSSFFLSFPRNRLGGGRGKRISLVLATTAAVLTAVYLMVIYRDPALYPLVRLLFICTLLAGIVTGITSLAVGYGRDQSVRLRQQRRIIITGTAAGFAPFVLCTVVPDLVGLPRLLQPEQSALALGLLPLAFGYAILKYDLLKLDTVIRRAAAHSLFVAALLCVYLAVIYLSGTLLAHLLTGGSGTSVGAPLVGAPVSPVPLIAATLAVGLLMAPLRALAQGGVERLLFPEIHRYHRLVREGDLPTEGTDLGVLAELLDTSVRTLLPVSGAHLFVREGTTRGEVPPGQVQYDCYTLCPPAALGTSRQWLVTSGSAVASPEGPSQLATNHSPLATGRAFSLRSSALSDALSAAPWGCELDELARMPGIEAEVVAEVRALGAAYVVPLRQDNAVTGVLALGPRGDGARLSGVERELVALIVERYALAVDHAVLLATLERQVRDISSLYQASAGLSAALKADKEDLPQHIIEAAAGIAGIERAELTLTMTEPPITVARSNSAGRSGAAPTCVRRASDEVLESLQHHLDVASLVEVHFEDGDQPKALLPLQAGERRLGLLRLERQAPHRFGAEEKRLLAMFANQAAVALEHAQLYGQAVHLAERDPLTDLYNHRMITGFLQRELARAARDSQPLSILIMDINGFKLFNDTYGHLAGDQLLKRVAQVLEVCCRQTDTAGRTGGDEFTVLLPRADPSQSHTIAERIHTMAAGKPYETADGRKIPLDLSIGVASFPHDGDAANALITHADERMYTAKRAGGGIQGTPRVEEEPAPPGRFGILEALVAAVDNKDSYTAKHSDQVARFATLLAAELNASQEIVRTLRLAGLLHDVGKIGVPDRVLRKPGPLTEAEREIMQQHVQLSEMLLRTVMPSPDLLDAVRYHHERWDGRGYPYGLAGEQVPLLGRIMIVADATSAMMMDRPYRKGLSWEVTCNELRRGAGGQFDRALIEPFIRAITAAGLDATAA
jgi:diguanylate cyclase (GGDEF)-like protein/putative nucleotidyltransferase with HDIG domain